MVCSLAPLVIALLTLASPAHAAFPGQNGKIAFARSFQESTFTRKIQIWSVNPDGSGEAVVNDTTGYDRTPAWSPDGRKIAFARIFDPSVDGTYEIYVMNADGTGATRLTNNSSEDSAPSWSPDGSRIAFEARRDGNWEIYAMNTDGTGQVNLTNNPGDDLDPAWSPDDSKIAFSAVRNGKFEIYAMNTDGTGQVNLTSALSYAAQPAWSPDGQRIAFAGPDGVYLMNADGSGATRVIPNAADVSMGDPAWSPDGRKLAFVRFGPRCGVGCSPSEISVAGVDGSGETQLTHTGPSMPNSGPDWQPIPSGPGYPRPKGATPFQTYLTVAYKQCTVSNTNRTHGTPLNVLACNPPQQQSMFLTVGTLDANGQAANAVGVYRLDVKSSPADVKMTFALKDVRNQSDLSDYTGELRVVQLWRITDKNNGPISGGGGTDPATNQDLAFPFDVTCATTADETIGSTCDSVSSANAVVPGSIQAGTRMNTQFLGPVNVEDGGSDGVAATTADNTLFMDEGIFVP